MDIGARLSGTRVRGSPRVPLSCLPDIPRPAVPRNPTWQSTYASTSLGWSRAEEADHAGKEAKQARSDVGREVVGAVRGVRP
jgi:hypothetical protein